MAKGQKSAIESASERGQQGIVEPQAIGKTQAPFVNQINDLALQRLQDAANL